MADEGKPSTFLNRLKEATSTVAIQVKEGVEDLQTKHELSQAYGDLGRLTADLVEGGAVSHPDLAAAVERIHALKAQLEEESPAADPPAGPTDG